MADAKLSALSEVSVPDFSDDIYLVDNTGPTSNKVGTDRLFGLGGFIPGGRLTLTTALPVTTADVTAAGTLYYTPYLHNLIRVWDGTRWLYKVFAESNLSLTLTADKNYDVFLDDDITTLSLSAAWTNDTTRADALGTQDSVQVLNSDKTKLWLGTIRASGTNTTEDSVVKRFVWNTYNRVERGLFKTEATATWTYSTFTFQQTRAQAANRIEVVVGHASSLIDINALSLATVATNGQGVGAGIGEDSTTAGAAGMLGMFCNQTAAFIIAATATLRKIVPLGYHAYNWLEIGNGSGTQTFRGDGGAPNGWQVPGLSGSVQS